MGDLTGMGSLEDHKGFGAFHPQFRGKENRHWLSVISRGFA